MSTKIVKQEKSIHIIGVEKKMSNELAFIKIPKCWEKFKSESILTEIPGKISNDIFGIYTNYENSGKNNEGQYSFIIGAEVSSIDEVPPGFVHTILPASNYKTFEASNKEDVGKKWVEIWNHDFSKNPRTFLADYERYFADAKIEIYVGVR